MPPRGEVHKCVILVAVLLVIAVNVAGEPTGQTMFCVVGVTVNAGAAISWPIVNTENVLQPVAGSVAVTVYCAGLQKLTFVPDAVPLKLIHV